MVLPDRIELSTSPLPMECSTTELRQHARIRNRPKRPLQAGGSCHNDPAGASTRQGQKGLTPRKKSGCGARSLLQAAQFGRNRFPASWTLRRRCLQQAKHDLEFDHLAGFTGFDAIDTPQLATCRDWRKIPAWHRETVPAIQCPSRQCTPFGHRCNLRVLSCARTDRRCRTMKQSASDNRGRL